MVVVVVLVVVVVALFVWLLCGWVLVYTVSGCSALVSSWPPDSFSII